MPMNVIRQLQHNSSNNISRILNNRTLLIHYNNRLLNILLRQIHLMLLRCILNLSYNLIPFHLMLPLILYLPIMLLSIHIYIHFFICVVLLLLHMYLFPRYLLNYLFHFVVLPVLPHFFLILILLKLIVACISLMV